MFFLCACLRDHFGVVLFSHVCVGGVWQASQGRLLKAIMAYIYVEDAVGFEDTAGVLYLGFVCEAPKWVLAGSMASR